MSVFVLNGLETVNYLINCWFFCYFSLLAKDVALNGRLGVFVISFSNNSKTMEWKLTPHNLHKQTTCRTINSRKAKVPG